MRRPVVEHREKGACERRLVVNLKTAKASNFTVRPTIMIRTDDE
jgi:hypothetical protein